MVLRKRKALQIFFSATSEVYQKEIGAGFRRRYQDCVTRL